MPKLKGSTAREIQVDMVGQVPPKALLLAIEAAEAGPQISDLEDAPLLQNWFFIKRESDAIRAEGDLSGHPSISDPWVTTSPVIGFRYDFGTSKGWLRSFSRWYRLGAVCEAVGDIPGPEGAVGRALAATAARLETHRNIWREGAQRKCITP